MNTAVFGQQDELIVQNYRALLPAAQSAPGAEVVIRDDLVLSSCLDFPDPGANHACLMRTTPGLAPALLAEIVEYFETRDLTPAVFVSEACSPDDWPRRLRDAGFDKAHTEYWMGLERAGDFWGAAPSPHVRVQTIGKDDALMFSEVYVQAFGMPIEFAPRVASLQQHFIGVPNTYHYVAFVDEKPVGVCSLVCDRGLGIIGSTGIIKTRRGARVFSSLAYQVLQDGKKHGLNTALIQIQDKAKFGRLLQISGFKFLFPRDCYVKGN